MQIAFQESWPPFLGYSIRYDLPHLSLINTVAPSVGPLEDQDGPVSSYLQVPVPPKAVGSPSVRYSRWGHSVLCTGQRPRFWLLQLLKCRCVATAIVNASATRNADRAPLASSGFSSRTFGDFKAGAGMGRRFMWKRRVR